MASARKCDRCGKYYDKPCNPKYILTRHEKLMFDNDIVDLCEDCHALLISFVEGSTDEKNQTNT